MEGVRECDGEVRGVVQVREETGSRGRNQTYQLRNLRALHFPSICNRRLNLIQHIIQLPITTTTATRGYLGLRTRIVPPSWPILFLAGGDIEGG